MNFSLNNAFCWLRFLFSSNILSPTVPFLIKSPNLVFVSSVVTSSVFLSDGCIGLIPENSSRKSLLPSLLAPFCHTPPKLGNQFLPANSPFLIPKSLNLCFFLYFLSISACFCAFISSLIFSHVACAFLISSSSLSSLTCNQGGIASSLYTLSFKSTLFFKLI